MGILEDMAALSPEELLRDGALTVAGAAEFSSLSESRLYELMDAGTLPYTKPDRYRRIPRRALVAILAAHLHRSEVDKMG